MIFLAAFSIDRLIAFRDKSSLIALFLSWIAFCLACLIKILPLLWLGIPILFIFFHGLRYIYKNLFTIVDLLIYYFSYRRSLHCINCSCVGSVDLNVKINRKISNFVPVIINITVLSDN